MDNNSQDEDNFSDNSVNSVGDKKDKDKENKNKRSLGRRHGSKCKYS